MKAAQKRQKRELVSASFSVRLKKDLRRNRFAYLVILPVLIWYFVFEYMPMYGILIAFKDYKPLLGFAKSQWVGLRWFKEFVTSFHFGRVVKNTLMLNVWHLILGFPAPIILALLLNEVRGPRFKKIVQTITYMPHFISLVVACGIIRMFVDSSGVVTQFINWITGTEHMNLLSYSDAFRPIYTLSGVWQGIGWGSIIYLSAMSNVDTELYDSVSVDGGGRWAKMWHVTLPAIRPVIVIHLIRNMGGMLSTGYQKIILLYNSLNMDKADVIASYVYRRGLVDANYSFSAAAGLLSAVFNLILLITANKLAAKYTETSLF